LAPMSHSPVRPRVRPAGSDSDRFDERP
jgi:hypothetical protein